MRTLHWRLSTWQIYKYKINQRQEKWKQKSSIDILCFSTRYINELLRNGGNSWLCTSRPRPWDRDRILGKKTAENANGIYNIL